MHSTSMFMRVQMDHSEKALLYCRAGSLPGALAGGGAFMAPSSCATRLPYSDSSASFFSDKRSSCDGNPRCKSFKAGLL